MRKKANEADIHYINTHQSTMTAEEISVKIDLDVKEVKKHITPPPKKKDLGNSKIRLKNGQTVIQMTDDIEHRPTKVKPTQTEEMDVKNGIYRG